jgi:RimJ/RimL family protein N-acetyltransferase
VTDSAPVLETGRLLLRPHRESDLPDCHSMWSDPATVKYIGGVPATTEEVWARMLRYAGHWTLKRYGYWVVEEKKSGRFAGEVGLADFKRGLVPSLGDAPEMGWVLASWAQGSGYAAEACRRVLEWAERNLAATRFVCLIHPENDASIRLARRLGFTHPQPAEYKGSPTLILECRNTG